VGPLCNVWPAPVIRLKFQTRIRAVIRLSRLSVDLDYLVSDDRDIHTSRGGVCGVPVVKAPSIKGPG